MVALCIHGELHLCHMELHVVFTESYTFVTLLDLDLDLGQAQVDPL